MPAVRTVRAMSSGLKASGSSFEREIDFKGGGLDGGEGKLGEKTSKIWERKKEKEKRGRRCLRIYLLWGVYRRLFFFSFLASEFLLLCSVKIAGFPAELNRRECVACVVVVRLFALAVTSSVVRCIYASNNLQLNTFASVGGACV